MEMITPQMGRAAGVGMSDPGRFSTAAGSVVSKPVALQLPWRAVISWGLPAQCLWATYWGYLGVQAETGVSLCGCSQAGLSTRGCQQGREQQQVGGCLPCCSPVSSEPAG